MPQQPLDTPGNPLRWAWGLTRALPALVVLVALLVVYNAGQLLSLLLLPLSPRAFRAYNRAGADLWWRCFAVLARVLHGARVHVTGDPLPERENVLLLANHQQMTDVCFLILLARRCGAAGDTKWFVKDAVKYVPLLGWGMLFLDNLFVKRTWTRDRASIERTFARIIGGRVPIWLMLFAEGTRLTPDKLASSRRMAERKGRRPFAHLLMPRTRGFTASIQGLRDHLDAVYDVTVGYEHGVPSLWQFICGFGPEARLHVRRFEVADLPDSRSELTDWLLARFEDKDSLLQTFYSRGNFAGADSG